jgi:1-acyl-sn-glycerol-3-phosphate acyltransferase
MTTVDTVSARTVRASAERWLPRRVVDELWSANLDPTDPAGRDPDFIEQYARPFCNWLSRAYFRAEFEGLEHVPLRPPFIAVANHSAAPILPDIWPMIGKWWQLFPLEQPSYALIHDAAFKVPVVRNLLIKLGGLRACTLSGERALDRGGVLLVMPGGDVEASRSYWQRNRIDLQGRTGVAKLALRYGAPVLPVVNVGGNEVNFTLLSGRRLARWTGLDRVARVKVLPLTVGLPWGIWPTAFVPYLPLPSKISYRIGPPLEFPRNPALAENRDLVERSTREISSAMQSMLSDLAARRRFPVFG